ncbi:group II intron reverse transcriptase/maturase [Cohnella sp. OV330]|uniref:reverse transcriptase domain-containing protein n=1 Tax=Cohnella sp. OV330 TaxID=1855288 RepID=UPI0008EB99AB|nr:reverse transcriptase domain-containing protein [Cohnella sp. OV330]SFB61793.1 group II intron reverse transcriptase/maturase [Cohnella sp. OV330]
MKRAVRYQISPRLIREAFKQSKKAKVVGVDGQTIGDYKRNLTKHLREQREQLTAGTYRPSPVRRVFIPKRKGGLRAIGIPTVKDFIVQTMLKNELYPRLDALFHPNSYGHKQKQHAREEAIRVAGKRCLRYDWTVVLDIQSFGDSVDHRLLMNMLRRHIRNKWVLLYTQRTIKAPEKTKSGTLIQKKKGLAQGNKLNFLLGNFYLHGIFDAWMQKNHPDVPFERYTDDIVCHCRSEAEAKALLKQIRGRLKAHGLTAHPDKTKIVYCKDGTRKGSYPNVSFEYLGSSFRSRRVKNASGKTTTRFAPE